MSELHQLLDEAYSCSRCPKTYGFSISPNGSYFKFPPIIGASSKTDILFIGINPRRSDTNLRLHDHLMTSRQAFDDLSANRVKGEAYITQSGDESHYRDHLEIIRLVYGNLRPFESCAAATELFHCASERSNLLPCRESPCAAYFLPKVLSVIQPKTIVAVGSQVFSYFKAHVNSSRICNEIFVRSCNRNIPVIKMPHPGNPNLSATERFAEIAACVNKLRPWLI